MVPCAGLLPAAAPAQRLDVAGLVDERLTPVRHDANSGTEATAVIGSMLAGGDSTDDTGPAVGGRAAPADLCVPMTIEVDYTIVPVFGRGKQGAAFGCTKVRGYHPRLATCVETGQALFARLRGGAAGAVRGAKSSLTETIRRGARPA